MSIISDKKNTTIWIVTVNYKTADLLIESLSSLLLIKKESDEFRYIAVDNDSKDDSGSRIDQYIKDQNISSWASVVSSDKNGGFSYGNNIGIRKALSSLPLIDYIMLLNPDTIVKEHAVTALSDFLTKNSEVGIVGSQILNDDNKIENSAHHFPSLLSAFLQGASLGFLDKLFPEHTYSIESSDKPYQCDWVSGSSMMVKREVFEKIGLLDDGFFLYFEEVDFFYRAKQAGWKTWYVPDSKVVHIEGASTGIKTNKRRPNYWYESRRRFFVKNYGICYLILTDFLWLAGRLTFELRCLIGLGERDDSDPKWLMTDLVWGDIKSLFSGELFRIQSDKA